jgi:hypothetical protein
VPELLVVILFLLELSYIMNRVHDSGSALPPTLGSLALTATTAELQECQTP